MSYELTIKKDAESLIDIADNKLIRQFTIKEKNKNRIVNDPIPKLKSILKKWNTIITEYYINELNKNNIGKIVHAYLPGKSIRTNANCHTQSDIIQFDFKGFYDSCRFDYFKEHLYKLDNTLDKKDESIIKRLLIDPKTKGVTQGLPVSGALAGLTLIPFWVKLKETLPENIIITQYSDDLTFSYTGNRPSLFTVNKLKNVIYNVLDEVNLNFTLNNKKTRIEKVQYRKVTGVRINHLDQTTPSRKDYRFLRHALFILSKSDCLDKELDIWGFESKESFVGKISYIRSIDSTNKVNKTILQYRDTCKRHNLFETWITDMTD